VGKTKNKKKFPENRAFDGKIIKSRTESNSDGYPHWRFSKVDRNGPFSWPGSTDYKIISEIITKLAELDSQKWNDFLGSDHHNLHPDSLSKDAKKRIAELRIDDSVDMLYSLRVNGKIRIICIRYGDSARLLWFDPEHKVAPAKLKHT
jgi:hypothetical protein